MEGGAVARFRLSFHTGIDLRELVHRCRAGGGRNTLFRSLARPRQVDFR